MSPDTLPLKLIFPRFPVRGARSECPVILMGFLQKRLWEVQSVHLQRECLLPIWMLSEGILAVEFSVKRQESSLVFFLEETGTISVVPGGTVVHLIVNESMEGEEKMLQLLKVSGQ